MTERKAGTGAIRTGIYARSTLRAGAQATCTSEPIKLQEWVRVKGLRLTPGRVKLPARQKGRRYKRPPENEQHFVPQKF